VSLYRSGDPSENETDSARLASHFARAWRVKWAWRARGFQYFADCGVAALGALGFGFYYHSYGDTLPSDIAGTSDSLLASTRWMGVNAVLAAMWGATLLWGLYGIIEYLYSAKRYTEPKDKETGEDEAGDTDAGDEA
jgi:hypothetical protein